MCCLLVTIVHGCTSYLLPEEMISLYDETTTKMYIILNYIENNIQYLAKQHYCYIRAEK